MKYTTFRCPDHWEASDPQIIAEVERENAVFTSWLGKKVKIKYCQQQEFLAAKSGEKIGRFVQLPTTNQWDFPVIVFLPARCKNKFLQITLGLSAGLRYTITILEIEDCK